MKVQFGLKLIRKITGADISVYIQQFAAILPVLHISLAAGYMALLARSTVSSFLFDVGVSTLPRAVVFGISRLYGLVKSELLLCFLILAYALALGLIAHRLFHIKRERSRVCHWIFIALIACDLVLRLMPFEFNRTFGVAPAIIGFVLNLAGLVLLVLDLYFDRRNESGEAALN